MALTALLMYGVAAYAIGFAAEKQKLRDRGIAGANAVGTINGILRLDPAFNDPNLGVVEWFRELSRRPRDQAADETDAINGHVSQLNEKPAFLYDIARAVAIQAPEMSAKSGWERLLKLVPLINMLEPFFDKRAWRQRQHMNRKLLKLARAFSRNGSGKIGLDEWYERLAALLKAYQGKSVDFAVVRSQLDAMISDGIRVNTMVAARAFRHTNGHPALSGSGEGYEFSSIRQYSDGDDVRMIDHKASARTGQTMVRSTYRNTDVTASIVVDMAAVADPQNTSWRRELVNSIKVLYRRQRMGGAGSDYRPGKLILLMPDGPAKVIDMAACKLPGDIRHLSRRVFEAIADNLEQAGNHSLVFSGDEENKRYAARNSVSSRAKAEAYIRRLKAAGNLLKGVSGDVYFAGVDKSQRESIMRFLQTRHFQPFFWDVNKACAFTKPTASSSVSYREGGVNFKTISGAAGLNASYDETVLDGLTDREILGFSGFDYSLEYIDKRCTARK
jgi:hypothetical protein